MLKNFKPHNYIMEKKLMNELTGGIGKDFNKLHAIFREKYTMDDSVRKLTKVESVLVNYIADSVRYSRKNHSERLSRVACRESIARLLKSKPPNDFVIFECLEWLESLAIINKCIK